MKLASAIEGGLTGASTLSLLQETLHKINPKAPRPLLHKSGVLQKLKKNGGKKGSGKLYIQLAGELLSNAAVFGMTGLGKKKNSVLRGGLLGAAAGLGSVFLTEDHEHDGTRLNGTNGSAVISNTPTLSDKILTVGLYTAGGILAGVAVKELNAKNKKGKKSKRKK